MRSTKRHSKVSKTSLLLLAIFVLALAIRLVPIFTHNHPIGVDAYYHFRQAESFKSGYDAFDELSFGGRPYVYQPTFHFFMAALSVITSLPVEVVAPIVITLLGSLVVVVVFFITRLISKNDFASLLAAAFLAVMPVFIWKTASNTLLTSVDMFLLSLAILFLMKREKTKYLVTASVLFLFSPMVGLLSMVLNVPYLKKKFGKHDYAWILFMVIFIVFSLQFFTAVEKVYISKDIPSEMQSLLTEDIGITDYFFRLNAFVIGFGVFGLYMMRKHLKGVLPLILILSVMLVSLVSGLLETDRALVYLALPLVMFSGIGAVELAKKRKYAWVVMIPILIASAFWGISSLRSLEWSAIPDSEYSALEWLRSNSPENSTILATPVEGHWVAYIGDRKNVIDTHLLGAVNFTERFDDVMTIYRTDDQSIRNSLMRKYNASYALYSDRFARLGFSIDKFSGYQPVYQKGFTVVFKVA